MHLKFHPQMVWIFFGPQCVNYVIMISYMDVPILEALSKYGAWDI